jgi:hypothetical protein
MNFSLEFSGFNLSFLILFMVMLGIQFYMCLLLRQISLELNEIAKRMKFIKLMQKEIEEGCK